MKLTPALLALLALATPAAAAPPPVPRLVVAISIDQFAAQLFDRNRARFRYGLKRLVSEGVVFPNGYQSHAATETCPGHSTLLTGRHPAATGIIGNVWYDRDRAANTYCVEDAAHPVPGREGQGRGPANLKVATLGEWMRRANPASRTVAVSGKDRAAITMAGHDPAGVFWWDDERGFTTSVPAGTTERDRLAPVVPINDAIDKRWADHPPRWTVEGQACVAPPVTRTLGTQGFTLESAVPPSGYVPPEAGASGYRTDGDFKKWLRATPVFDEITVEAAEALIDHYRLGRGAAPDLLAVSLSATDYIGHRYGNDGPEMCDQIAHLDRLLGRFLDRLDGLGVPVLVVLTADHGAVDFAERAAERGAPAQRIDIETVVREVGKAVQAELKLPYYPLAGDAQQLTVAGFGMDERTRARVIAATVRRLRARPEVAAVLTQAEVAKAIPRRGTPADELTLAERFAESTDARRSGDIMIAFRPYATLGEPAGLGDTVAGHGSPWNYDRRVPILFWWKGADPFEQPAAIETVDIAPTLAALLRVPAPAVDGQCRDLDRSAADSCRPAN